jgi:hypothetical protein
MSARVVDCPLGRIAGEALLVHPVRCLLVLGPEASYQGLRPPTETNTTTVVAGRVLGAHRP